MSGPFASRTWRSPGKVIAAARFVRSARAMRYPRLATLALVVLAACDRGAASRARDTAGTPVDSAPRVPSAIDTRRDSGAPVRAPVDSPARAPAADDVASVVRAYFAALAAGDSARAAAAWGENAPPGAARSDTAFADVDVGAPGPLGAAAGSRYVDVPVTAELRAPGRAPARRQGVVTLRRVVVDGASERARRWHIERIVWRPT